MLERVLGEDRDRVINAGLGGSVGIPTESAPESEWQRFCACHASSVAPSTEATSDEKTHLDYTALIFKRPTLARVLL